MREQVVGREVVGELVGGSLPREGGNIRKETGEEKGVSTSTLRHTNITQLDLSILGLTCLMKGAATIVSPHILVNR